MPVHERVLYECPALRSDRSPPQAAEPGRFDAARFQGFEEALEGIEEFSHITVLFWMHQSPVWDASTSKIHPQRRADLPLVGVLATHSPFRPNPLGLTTVRLLEREGSTLRVVGLDAIDGTPVVDIKPRLPEDETVPERVPDWVPKLRQYDNR